MNVLFSLLMLVLIVVPAFIAKKKGRSFPRWLALSLFLWFAALPASLFLKANTRKCLKCAEYISPDAKVCRYCHSEIGEMDEDERKRMEVFSSNDSVISFMKGAVVSVILSSLAFYYIPSKQPTGTTVLAAPDKAEEKKADTSSLIDNEAIAEKNKPEVEENKSAYQYDTASYCKGVSDAIGGSYVIEKSCMEEENSAKHRIDGITIPTRVSNYCDNIAKTIGGSYVIAESCIKEEINARNSMK